MRLDDLAGLDFGLDAGSAGIEISGITADSRQVVPGSVFAALRGSTTDGGRFVADAVSRGAAAILAGSDDALPDVPVPVLRSTDPRRSLALLAAHIHPRQP